MSEESATSPVPTSTGLPGDRFTVGGYPVTGRHVLMLVSVLLVAKVAVFSGMVLLIGSGDHALLRYLTTVQGLSSLLHAVGTSWDSAEYQMIAATGYTALKGSYLYAFSPFYPLLIRGGHVFLGSYVTSSLLVTNLLSFVFPVVVLRLFGFRTALLAELFPVYVVYSMVAYSDVVALVFLSLGLLCFARQRYLLAGVSLGLAGLVFYDLFVASLALAGWVLWEGIRRTRRPGWTARALLSLLLPVTAAGLGVLAFYWLATGNPLTFFALERAYWGVLPTTPFGQVEWIYHGSGIGSFIGFNWNLGGLVTSPTYWAARNVLFEAFFFIGVFLLSRTKGYPLRWPLVGYSLVVSLPLLFIEGTPVYSMPRLLLAAFPAFLGYSANVFVRPWTLVLYGGVSLLAASWVLLSFTFGFFS